MSASAKLAVQKHALMLCADDTSGPAGSASDHRNHTSATGAALCPFMRETGAMTCLFNLEQDPSEPELRPHYLACGRAVSAGLPVGRLV